MPDPITPPSGFEPPQAPPISDDDADALLRGSPRPGHDDIAQVIADLRRTPQPAATIGVELGEFVASPPTRPPSVDELPPVPPPEPTGERISRGRPLARLALAAGIGIVGVSGAHAAGVVDVPGLPDRGGTEVVFADEADADRAGEDGIEPPVAGSDDEGPPLREPVEATLSTGDLSVTISVGSEDGESFTVVIDVEGVSPECEAALESLSGTYTSGDGAEAAAADAEAACGDDFDLVFPDLADPEAFQAFLEGFEFSLDLPEGFGGFFDDEFGGLGDFDLDELEQLLEDFDFDRLEEHFGQHGHGGFFFDLDEIPDGFDPDELDRFFDDLDPETFGNFFDDLDPETFGNFFDDLDPETFGQYFGELPLDPESLDGFLDEFDADRFDGFLHELDPESFGKFFEEFFDEAGDDEIGA